MFTSAARELRSTLESMATPCSVKAYGKADRFLRDVVTICDRIVFEVKNEITREPIFVSPECLIESFGRDLIEHRKVGIEHNLFAPNEKNQWGNIFRLWNNRHGVLGG